MDKLPLKEIPRRFRRDLANICRRANKVPRALKILTPLVELEDISAAELIEYSFCLTEIGVTEQASRMIEKLNADEHPEILLQKVQSLVVDWNYKESIPLLRTYIDCEKTSSYQKTIGKVNLAAALSYSGDDHEARDLLAEIREIALQNDWDRLLANTFELEAQLALDKGQLNSAERWLDQATELLNSRRLVDSHYIQKWKCLLASLKAKDLSALEEFQTQSFKDGYYESVRSLDIQKLNFRFDQLLLDKLYFGSPFAGFKQMLVDRFGPVSDHFLFGDSTALTIDLQTGQRGDQAVFKYGSSVHKVTRALCQDLYRPQKIGALFCNLFPGEHFDILSSPNRVRLQLHRARKLYKDKGIELGINELNDCYRLETFAGGCVLLQGENTVQSPYARQLQALENHFAGQAFSVAQAQDVLNEKSRSTLNRIVRHGVDSERLKKEGSGSRTVYRFS